MAYDYGAKLTAARERHKEAATWPEAAESIGAAESTLRGWDAADDPEWRAAEEAVFAEMRREGRGVAWRGLLKAASAKTPDVAACKELLNRCEGAVPEEHRHGLTEESIALMRQRERKPDGSGP